MPLTRPTESDLRALFPNATPEFIRLNAAPTVKPSLTVPAQPPAPAQRPLRRASRPPSPMKTAEIMPTRLKRKGRRVERTRNGGTWTEAEYWGRIRSHLRRLFRFWKPAADALRAVRVAGPRGFLYRCSACGSLFPRKQVEADHRIPCGKLLQLEDLPGFVGRLTPEDPAAFQVLCEGCHRQKTATERESRAAK